jgi:hypothetical protein
MNKITFPGLIFTLLLSLQGFAQDSLITRSSNQFIHTDFGFGYRYNNLGALNNTLKGFGYKPLNENFSTFSLSLSASARRFVFQTEASIFFSSDTDVENGLKATLEGHSFGWAVGYSVIEKPRLRLYPYVGFQSAFSHLKVKDQTLVGGMGDLINSPKRNFTLDFVSTSLNLGFQLERIVPIENRRYDCPQNTGFATIGLRAGYLIGLSKGKGEYNNQEVNGAPSYAVQGPYVTLFIGYGTKLRRMNWKK